MLNLASYFLYLLVFFLPIITLPYFADPYDLPKVLFFYGTSFLLGLIVGLSLLFKKTCFLPQKIFLGLAGLIIVAFSLSFKFSLARFSSFMGLWDLTHATYTGGLLQLLTLILLFGATSQLVKKINLLFFLSLYLTASALLISLNGFFQYLQGFERIRASFGEANRLALFLIMVLPLSLALFLNEKKSLYKIPVFLSFLFILLAIILTFSRTAWLTLALVSLLAILNSSINLNFLRELKKFLVIFCLFLLGLCFFLGQPIFKRLTASIADLQQGQGSTWVRLGEWQAGWQIWQNQPLWRQLVGTGPETLKYTFPRYRPAFFNQFFPDKFWQVFVLRQQYLHWLNTVGLMGLLAYLLLIGWTVFCYWQQPKKTLFQKAFFYSWLLIVIGGFFYYWTITSYTYFWLFLAVILKEKTLKFRLKFKFKIALSFAIFCCFLGLVFFGLITAAFFQAYQGNWQKAKKLTPFFDFWWREDCRQKQNEALEQNKTELILEAIKSCQQAYQLNPQELTNLEFLQAAYYKAAAYLNLPKTYQNEAQKLGQRWLELDPTNPVAADALGLSFWNLGELEKAKEQFQKALRLDPAYFPAKRHLTELLSQLDKKN